MDDALRLIGLPVVGGSLGVTFATQPIVMTDSALEPFHLPQPVFRGVKMAFPGVMVVAPLGLPPPEQCRASEFCKFASQMLGDAFSLLLQVAGRPSGVTFAASFDVDVVLARSSRCISRSGSGRLVPLLTLASMYVVLDLAVGGLDALTLEVGAVLTVDVGLLRGDDCSLLEQPRDLLDFTVSIALAPDSVVVSGSLRGLWHRPMGLDFLSAGPMGVQLSVVGGAGFAIDGTLYLGRRCWSDEGELQHATCLAGRGGVKMAPADPTDNFVLFSILPDEGATGETVLDLAKVVRVLAAADSASESDWARTLPRAVRESGFYSPSPEHALLTVSYSQFGGSTPSGDAVPAGLRVAGGLRILGYHMHADVVYDYPQRLFLSGFIDPFAVGSFNGRPAFSVLRAAGSAEGPTLNVDVAYDILENFSMLRSTPDVSVEIYGYVEVLGVAASVAIRIGETDLHVLINGPVMGRFMAEITVVAAYGQLSQLSFDVEAKFDRGLFEELKAAAHHVLNAAKDAARLLVDGASAGVRDVQVRNCPVPVSTCAFANA